MKNRSPFCRLDEEQVQRLQNKILLNGELVTPRSTSLFTVVHSARKSEVCTQVDCNAEDVQNAIEAATHAKSGWASRSGRDRGALLRKGVALVQKHSEELAQLLTLETSKALKTESELDFRAAADVLDFFSGLGSELKGETIPFRSDVLAYTLREPLGVVGAILPWNVPLLLMALKIGPALIAGNTVVVKTSEYAPLAALRFGELLSQELPPGVLNVISGHGNPTGQALVAHPGINKITFTGSVSTGKTIYQSAAGRLIPVTLELGGKSPMIVCSDADVDSVVQGAFQGMRFTRQGQSCSASSRIYVHADIYDAFVEKLGDRLNRLVIGDPFDPSVEAGAVACQMQYDKIVEYIKTAGDRNIKQYNSLPTTSGLEKGLFLRPTLATELDEDHRLVKEEIFGPVACVFRWKDLSDVLQKANKTSFGLAATVWTQDLKKALYLTERLEAGFVQVNQNLVVQATLAYGGFKNSGLGKEASLGSMLEHFTRSKTVLIAK